MQAICSETKLQNQYCKIRQHLKGTSHKIHVSCNILNQNEHASKLENQITLQSYKKVYKSKSTFAAQRHFCSSFHFLLYKTFAMVVTNWACIKCGVTNEKTAFRCQTCQEPKPIFWECSSCKVKNPTASLKCNGCKRKRPAIFGNTVNVSNQMPPPPPPPNSSNNNNPKTMLTNVWPASQGQAKSNAAAPPSMPFPGNTMQQSKNNNNYLFSNISNNQTFNSTISGFSAANTTSTLSQATGNSTMSSLSQSVSSYDIFVK